MREIKIIIRNCFLLLMLFLIIKSNICANSKTDILKKRITVGLSHFIYSNKVESDQWIVSNVNSIKAEVSKYQNIEFYIKGGRNQIPPHISDINDFFEKKMNFIVFVPYTKNEYDKLLENHINSNSSVILLINPFKVKDSLYTSSISNNYFEEAEKAAKWLIDNYDKVKNPDKSNKNINIVELNGFSANEKENIPQVTEFQLGFSNVIKQHNNFKITHSIPGFFQYKNIIEPLKKLMKKKTNNIDVIFSHNDSMAMSAIEVIKDFGLKPGKDIIVISIGGSKHAINAIIRGEMNCSVEVSADYGKQLIDTIIKIANGESVSKKVYVENEKIFTKENAAIELPNREY